MIKIYPAECTKFDNNGFGTFEPLLCEETKRIGISGWYIEVQLSPKHDQYVAQDRIVLVETKEHGAQPFRIKNVEKTDRKITFTADHVFFDSENMILADSRPTNLGAVQAVNWIVNATDRTNDYTVSGDAVRTEQTHYFIRKSLYEAISMLQKDYDVTIDPHGFNISVVDHVGTDTGMSLVYGKNIQGVSIVESWDEVCTKVLPVGPDGILLDDVYLLGDIEYDREYTKVVSFDFETQNENGVLLSENKQKAILRDLATAYLKEHEAPQIKYSVQSDIPQDLHIGDTVHIKHPMLMIDARVIEYVYDCTSKKVKRLTFGNYDNSNTTALDKKIGSIANEKAEEKANVLTSNRISRYDEQLAKLYDSMSGAFGLYITAEVTGNGGKTYYLHDKPEKEKSSVIYTANENGFAMSKDGGKTYTAGFDSSGNAVVNVLSAIGVNADWLEAGIIRDQAGKNYWNLETGEISINASARVGNSTLGDMYEELSDSVSANAQSISENSQSIAQNAAAQAQALKDTESDLSDRMGQLESALATEYVLESSFSVYKDRVEARVNETAQGLEEYVKETSQVIDKDGVHIGTSDTETISTITGRGMAVTGRNGEILAQFTTGRSQIQSVAITDDISFGAHKADAYEDYEWDGVSTYNSKTTGTGYMYVGDIK